MSQSAAQQLESELIDDVDRAPGGIGGNAHVAIPKRPRSLNAIAHGISGHNIMLTAEELPCYAQMGLDFMREMQPVGAVEISTAQLIFESRWRLHRIGSVENSLFSIERAEAGEDGAAPIDKARRPGLAQQVNAFREDAGYFDLLVRYEDQLIRNSKLLSRELSSLQRNRLRTAPHLTFDEASSSVLAWYRKLIARCGALDEARQAYDDYIHDADPAAPDAPVPKSKPKTRKHGA